MGISEVAHFYFCKHTHINVAYLERHIGEKQTEPLPTSATFYCLHTLGIYKSRILLHAKNGRTFAADEKYYYVLLNYLQLWHLMEFTS
jgi:hypothetical protein